MKYLNFLQILVLQKPYLTLWVAALALRLVAAIMVKQPGFVDAYYYYQVAANWQAGKGLTETTVWNYQASSSFDPLITGSLEHPAFTYWTPLATFLTIIPFSLFGVSYWAASLPFMLCGAALAPLAYWLGQLLFGREQLRYSWTMALITLFPGRFFLFWNTPDNFAPFALIILLGLAATYLGLYRNDRWLLLAGVMAGLAYLSRSDGSLFSLALLISFWWRRRTLGGQKGPRWAMLLAGLALAGVIVAPWLGRNWSQFGSILPANNSKVLFLRSYLDFFSYSLRLDAGYYLGWGWGNIAFNKLQTLLVDGLLITFQGLLLLGPLFLVGLWALRRKESFQPFLIYTLVLYFILGLGFSEIGSHGTIFHSTGGLLPFQAGLALAGLEWLGRGKARPQAASILILIAAGVTLYFAFAVNAPAWDSDYNAALILKPWFDLNASPKDVIMVGEPLSFNYATGRPAISQASDGTTANLAALKQYGAKWFVLGPERYAGLDQLYNSHRLTGPGLQLVLADVVGQGIQIYKVVITNNNE